MSYLVLTIGTDSFFYERTQILPGNRGSIFRPVEKGAAVGQVPLFAKVAIGNEEEKEVAFRSHKVVSTYRHECNSERVRLYLDYKPDEEKPFHLGFVVLF